MDNFINGNENRQFLRNLIDWWHERMGFIFRAFAPKDAPQMNQAEAIHAGWAHRDLPNLSLLDVCQADVRDSVVLNVQLKAFSMGAAPSGTGPSFADRTRRNHLREISKAKQMGRELLQNSEKDGRLIDPLTSYHPEKTKNKASSTNKKQRTSKESGQSKQTDDASQLNMPLQDIPNITK